MSIIFVDFTSKNVIDKLAENGINYVAVTLFNQEKPVISYCNNTDWLGIYNSQFDVQQRPPVQKYIFSSKLRILNWDLREIDKLSKDFIQHRNDVVEAFTNITLLYRNNEFLSSITLGTKYNNTHLYRFLNNEESLLLNMERNLVNVHIKS